MCHDHGLRARIMKLSSDLCSDTQTTDFRHAEAVEQLALLAQEIDAMLKVFLIRVHNQRILPHDPDALMIDMLRDNMVVSNHKNRMDAWVQQANSRRNRAFKDRLSA
jgi:hypothetical protein